MRILHVIYIIFLCISQHYSQELKEFEDCILLETKAGSKENRVLKRIEKIIKRFGMTKENFYVSITYSERGDTVLLFSKYAGDEREQNTKCGILQGDKMAFSILYDGEEVRKFFHLDKRSTTKKVIFMMSDRRNLPKIRKNLDIYVYKSYEDAMMLYGIAYVYEKCKMPSIDSSSIIIFNEKKRRKYCDYTY